MFHKCSGLIIENCSRTVLEHKYRNVLEQIQVQYQIKNIFAQGKPSFTQVLDQKNYASTLLKSLAIGVMKDHAYFLHIPVYIGRSQAGDFNP